MATRFKDYSVSTKISAVMGFVLITAAALGIFSVLQLYRLNTNSIELRDSWLPATRIVGEVRYEMTRFRAMTGMYMLCVSDDDRNKQEKRLDARLTEISGTLHKYDELVRPGEERALADRVIAAWSAYEPMYHKLLETQKTNGQDAAAVYLRLPMRDSFDALNAALDAAIRFENDGGVAAGNESASTYSSARIWSILAVAMVVVFCVGAGMVLVRAVSGPLVRMTGAMGELAAGHLDAEVPHTDQGDEIGQLAGAMMAFKDQLAAAERSKTEQTQVIVSSIGAGLDHLAKGDLTHRVTAELTGPFAKLKEDFNAAMSRLQDTLKNVLSSTGQITSGASEISQAADDLSRRTEQQAASLEETAAALEQITATMKKTASNTRQVDTSTAGATAAAVEGGKVVETAITAMDSIAQSSKEITEIIGVIDEIAFQTNLLALNAGVEAARAGDAGKGFAVVAMEVRELAGRSSEAAKKIKALINTSGEHVEGGVKLVGESGRALKSIVDQVQQINALVSEMAGAAEQQSTGIQEVNAAVSQMDQVTQQNAAMVEQSTAASRNLAHETQVLQELVSFFNVGNSSAAVARSPQVRTDMQRSPAAPRPAVAASRSASKAAGWSEF